MASRKKSALGHSTFGIWSKNYSKLVSIDDLLPHDLQRIAIKQALLQWAPTHHHTQHINGHQNLIPFKLYDPDRENSDIALLTS